MYKNIDKVECRTPLRRYRNDRMYKTTGYMTLVGILTILVIVMVVAVQYYGGRG